MSYEIIEKLKKEIEGFKDDARLEAVGTVVEAADGVAKLSGLGKVMSQEMLEIETENGAVRAVAFNLEENFVGTVILGDFKHVKVGQTVRPLGTVLSVPVGVEIVGRVVDPLGEPLDGKGPLFPATHKPSRN